MAARWLVGVASPGIDHDVIVLGGEAADFGADPIAGKLDRRIPRLAVGILVPPNGKIGRRFLIVGIDQQDIPPVHSEQHRQIRRHGRLAAASLDAADCVNGHPNLPLNVKTNVSANLAFNIMVDVASNVILRLGQHRKRGCQASAGSGRSVASRAIQSQGRPQFSLGSHLARASSCSARFMAFRMVNKIRLNSTAFGCDGSKCRLSTYAAAAAA